MNNLSHIRNTILKKELTLLPPKTLDNIKFCITEVINNNIEGDFIETGVWRGGAVIYAYHVLKEFNSKRKIYVADSFSGLPKPNIRDYPQDMGDPHWKIEKLKISLEEVKSNFKLFGDIDENIIFLKGWFKNTLYTNDIKKLSVLRLDGDMYESTWQALDALYPKLSVSGYCIIDDFGHVRAKKATLDYRQKYEIEDEIVLIDKTSGAYPSIYWKKTK